jgi:L-fuculose-phosphate aldolase
LIEVGEGNEALLTAKTDLVKCVRDLYTMGYTSPISGNHSFRAQNKNWMWITPSGIPRYNLKEKDLVMVNIQNGKTASSQERKPSSEWYMHASIYNRSTHINAVVHTHSPYTLGIAISKEKFQHILEEAKIVVGNPIIVPNEPSGSAELANIVSEWLENWDPAADVRAIIIRNHGVVTVGTSIHQARATVEALEEWAKMLTISRIFGGPQYSLQNNTKHRLKLRS